MIAEAVPDSLVSSLSASVLRAGTDGDISDPRYPRYSGIFLITTMHRLLFQACARHSFFLSFFRSRSSRMDHSHGTSILRIISPAQLGEQHPNHRRISDNSGTERLRRAIRFNARAVIRITVYTVVRHKKKATEMRESDPALDLPDCSF